MSRDQGGQLLHLPWVMLARPVPRRDNPQPLTPPHPSFLTFPFSRALGTQKGWFHSFLFRPSHHGHFFPYPTEPGAPYQRSCGLQDSGDLCQGPPPSSFPDGRCLLRGQPFGEQDPSLLLAGTPISATDSPEPLSLSSSGSEGALPPSQGGKEKQTGKKNLYFKTQQI